MSLLLGAVADDYTGASDLANTFTKAGLRTLQTIGVPEPGLDLPDVDAVVVALKSRSIPAQEAVALSLKLRAGCARGGRGMCCSRCAPPSIPPMPAISARSPTPCALNSARETHGR